MFDRWVSPDWRDLSVDDQPAEQWVEQRLAAHAPRIQAAEYAPAPSAGLRLTVEWNLVGNPRLELPLLEQLTLVCGHLGQELGLPLPSGALLVNPELPENHYRLRLGRQIVTRPQPLRPDQILAISPPEKLGQLPGAVAPDPTYGMPSKWIPVSARSRAERLGCMIFDPVGVVATQVTEIARGNARLFLDDRCVQRLLSRVADTRPHLVELAQQRFPLPRLTELLAQLVEERVSILDLPRILHVALDCQPGHNLLTSVRQSLGAQICASHLVYERKLNCIVLDPRLLERLRQPAPELLRLLEGKMIEAADRLAERGLQPTFVCSAEVRHALSRWASRFLRGTPVVLAWSEIPDDIAVERLETIEDIPAPDLRHPAKPPGNTPAPS